MAATAREKARTKVIEVLNKARAMELQAIGQYMNQHYNLDDMDYGDLAAKMKLIAIDEMRHAEMFAERLKELGGEPTVDPTAKAGKGQDAEIDPVRVALTKRQGVELGQGVQREPGRAVAAGRTADRGADGASAGVLRRLASGPRPPHGGVGQGVDGQLPGQPTGV